MTDWGPADWYVVIGGALAVLSILFALLMALPDAWDDLRESMRRLPKGDERDRVPYKRPR